MNVAQFFKSVLHRPLACAAIVVLAIAAGIAGWNTVPSQYQSNAVAVVLPPGGGNPDAMLNPLINMDNEVAQLAAVIATAIRTDGAEAAVAAGGTADFTVNTVYGESAQFAQLSPQLVIQATGPTADSARNTTEALVTFARTTLDRLQADAWVPNTNNAVIVAAVAPQPGSPIDTKPLRGAAAYAAAAVLGGLIVVALWDGVIQRVRTRRQRSAHDTDRVSDADGRQRGEANPRHRLGGAETPGGDEQSTPARSGQYAVATQARSSFGVDRNPG